MRNFLRQAFTEHVGLKLLSLGLALVVYLIVRADKDAVASGYVVVDYKYDATKWVLISKPPRQLRISVRGPWSKVNRFDDRSIPPVKVKVEAIKKELLSFTPDMIRVPPGLQVVAISPPTAEIRVERLVERKVPLTPRVVGEVAQGYALRGRAVTAPATVLLRGPKSVLDRLAKTGLSLSPVDVTNAEGSIVRKVDVVSSLPDYVKALTSLKVMVRQEVVALEGKRTLPDVPVVTFGIKWPNFTPVLEFASVTVQLKGPRPVLAGIDPKQMVSLVLDLSAESKGSALPPASLTKSVGPADVKGLPPGVLVEFVRPQRVIVKFVKKQVVIAPPP